MQLKYISIVGLTLALLAGSTYYYKYRSFSKSVSIEDDSDTYMGTCPMKLFGPLSCTDLDVDISDTNMEPISYELKDNSLDDVVQDNLDIELENSNESNIEN